MLSLGPCQLKFMRLFFSIWFVFVFSGSLLAKNFEEEYLVKTKGLVIGELNWKLKMSEDYYETSIKLKSRGLISALYKFEGLYGAFGNIQKKKLFPKEYFQNWTTKKKRRDVKIIFYDFEVSEMLLVPKEKEFARIEYVGLSDYSDPLTSFVNILLGAKYSYTIDGRRVYKLLLTHENENKKILIKEYKNIWADHSRNDLEYLEVYSDKDSVLPLKIKIMFKGSVFSLIKN